MSWLSKLQVIDGGKITIGARTSILPFALLATYGGDIVIGDDCSVNPFCVLYGHGGLHIGNGVRIAAHSVFIPANHVFEDKSRRIMDQGLTAKGIVVEDDVWIGAGVRVLDGVCIGSGCVIAAGSIVSKSTKPYGVYAGVPSRLIRYRK